MISGFLYTTRHKRFFYKTNSKNITKAVIDRFLDEIDKNCSVYHDQIVKIKLSAELQNEFKRGIAKATIEKMSNNGFEWYRISGKWFQINRSIDEFNRELVIFE